MNDAVTMASLQTLIERVLAAQRCIGMRLVDINRLLDRGDQRLDRIDRVDDVGP